MPTEPRRPRVGVLALQGAVREHLAAIREVGADPVEVRLPRDLVDLDALILPGGESTTMRKLIDDRNLATRMGEEGHRMASAMTWSDAVRQLLA